MLHRNLKFRSMKQGKLDMTKQEMARLYINILGISDLKGIGMGEFNSDDHYICYVDKNPLEGMEYLIINERIRNEVFGYNLKKDRIISVCFQGKPLNITVIQVCTPTTNAEEAEVE